MTNKIAVHSTLIFAACELEKCVANHGGDKDLLKIASKLRGLVRGETMKNLIKAYHKAYPAVKGPHGVECDTCGSRVEGDKPYVAVLCFDCWSKGDDHE